MRARSSQPNPAQNIVSGTIDKEQTWKEDIELTLDGAPLTGVSSHDWILTLYKEPGCSPDLTLSTADGTLTITESTQTILGIRCASTRLASLCDDYWCDIIDTDASTTVDGESQTVLRARGVVTVTEGAS